MYDEAIEILNDYEKIAKPTWVKLCRAYVDAHMGKRDEARKKLEELESDKTSGHISLYFVALTYFVLKDTDKAFEYFDKAYETGEHEFLNLRYVSYLEDFYQSPDQVSN